jgi:hypothetical protein
VFEEEKAKEKYQDAIANGDSAVMVSENKQDKDVMKIDIGNILPSEEVIVSIQMIKSIEIEGGAYCVRLPLTYFPRKNFN